jgi:predicted permease
MLSTLLLVLPIFGLILAGFACRRLRVLGPNASPELNRFVVYLALPALLFDAMAHTPWHDIYQPGFLLSFGGGSVLVYIATVLMRMRGGGKLATAGIDGLNGSYANTGFMGFPLCMAALGASSLIFVSISMIIVVACLFSVSIVLIEISQQSEHGVRQPGKLALKVASTVLRHPLVISPIAGMLWGGIHVPLPESLDVFLKMLGAAASPCALVALGLFLAEKRQKREGDGQTAAWLVFVKLFIHPALTWVIAVPLLRLPPEVAVPSVLLAALPTGTGPFMLAEFYRCEAVVTSKTILWSTVVSVITVTLYLNFAGVSPH